MISNLRRTLQDKAAFSPKKLQFGGHDEKRTFLEVALMINIKKAIESSVVFFLECVS